MKIKILFFFALLITLSSCKKNQLGGSSVIKGKVSHHSKAISNAIIYIKFNAKEFPGNEIELYDHSLSSDVNGEFSIACYKGDYYLFAKGIDDQLSQQKNVSGGVPVNIRNNEIVEMNLAVSE
jgi:hypothetical protein